jgi:hypothetical protein
MTGVCDYPCKMRDVARLVGDSTATVYRVTIGSNDASRKTSDSVLEARRIWGNVHKSKLRKWHEGKVASQSSAFLSGARVMPEIDYTLPIQLGVCKATRDR